MNMLLLLFHLFLNSPIYNFQLPGLTSGTSVHLSDFEGKYLLIVNIASGSAQAQQVGKLQELYERHQDSLVVIAIPSNSFGHEAKTGVALRQWLDSGFQVSYPVTAPVAVKGEAQHALFTWLTRKTTNQMMDCEVVSDFQKFLFNKSGKLIGVYGGMVDPMGRAIGRAMERN